MHGRPCGIRERSATEDTGGWISDAEVAETVYTAYASTSHPVTARLIVRRVKDAAILDSLFPVWRHHPFFANTTLPTTTADVTHRAHAIIEDRKSTRLNSSH